MSDKVKGLFISLYDITADHVKGIRKKIEAQVKYFDKNCQEFDWIYKNSYGKIVCNKKEIYNGSKIKKELISTSIDFFKLKRNIDIEKYDFIYIRYIIGNIGLFNFIKYAAENNVKVLLEIPTYPYLDEMYNDIQGKLKCKIDNYITDRLYNYVYKIVCTNKDSMIFNIQTIQIDNGVDLDRIKCISTNKKNNGEFINAIAVASICRWHGYDRFINAMKEYRKKYNLNVKFYIVGDGRKEDINELKKIVIENNLQENVIFTGPKDGKELDELYEKMDFSVSSLALFRAGGGHNPIKTKEYIAKGLPVVTGYDDNLVHSSLDFIYKVNEDESIFSLEKIINWYNDGNFCKLKIRKYAEKNVSWDIQISNIISAIKE